MIGWIWLVKKIVLGIVAFSSVVSMVADSFEVRAWSVPAVMFFSTVYGLIEVPKRPAPGAERKGEGEV